MYAHGGSELANVFCNKVDAVGTHPGNSMLCAPVRDEVKEVVGCILLIDRRAKTSTLMQLYGKGREATTFSDEESDLLKEFGSECGKEFRQCEMFTQSWRAQQLLQRFLRFTPGRFPTLQTLLQYSFFSWT
mmetsp:Transcript_13661/g.21341  ORF Transcript_13661/g.21341 Transcript_13661/m.21341 type:complete len:131 (-) Transcript_13661:1410-1802(-)